jgi:integrase
MRNRIILETHNLPQTVRKYIDSVASVNINTAYEYQKRLDYFGSFLKDKYNLSFDELVDILTFNRTPSVNVYDLLSSYVAYHQKKEVAPSAITIKAWVTTVKNFLEYWDVEISPKKFKLKVRLPRVVRQSKEALSKEDIVNILNTCSSIKLKTYYMFLAATGCRATEAIATRLCDYDFNVSPARVFIRGEFTKTRTDRYIFLTKELEEQLKKWLDFKYRTREISHYNKEVRKSTKEIRSPDRTKRQNDLVFSSSSTKDESSIEALYVTLQAAFEKTLDRMGGKYAALEDSRQKRHKITLHSFRRWVKSTISDLGYSDYSEWFIGHAGSTYYRKGEKERADLFRKIEPYLTYLDYAVLERKGADTNTRIEELETINQMLRQKDAMNADAIAGLSDRMDEIMTKMKDLENKDKIS